MAWVLHYFLPFILILSVLVFFHELGHFWVARRSGVRVLTFSIGFGPELFGWTDRHKTRWRFSLIPLGGYVKMFGDSDPSSAKASSDFSELSEEEKQQTLYAKHPKQKIAVALAGPAANYILATVLLTLLISIKGLPHLPPTIGSVQKESPAAVAGLQTGDEILQANGHKISEFQELRTHIQAAAGKELQIQGRRNKEIFSKTINLYKVDPKTKKKEDISRLGITPGQPVYEPMSPFMALGASLHLCWKMSADSFMAISQMITGHKGGAEVGGILSIGDMAAQSTQNGWASLVWFMASLSISLGFINLLPVPVLDGGHVLLGVIEWLRGKALSEKAQNVIFSIGFALVMSLMVYATWSDIKRYKIVHLLTSFVTHSKP